MNESRRVVLGFSTPAPRHFCRSATGTLLASLIVLGAPSGVGFAQTGTGDTMRAEPEAASGRTVRKTVIAKRHMVVAANPYASRAGLKMLRKGGSAIDAAIAAQLVLNLVEPQSSGLGGGAFILHWDAKRRALSSFDGRETAPAAATPDRFLKPGGEPRPFREVVASGLSIGVPGLLRVLEMAHQRHGRLPWKDLFQPAIELAEGGFIVSPRLHKLLRWAGAKRFSGAARAYFYPNGRPLPVGYRLRNPEFAKTLRLLAGKGAKGFYTGALAKRIVKAARGAPRFASDMTLADLASYKAVMRNPVCVTYRKHKICGMGPPSSGGPTVGQILKLLEPFDLTKPGFQSLHLIGEAEKLSYADRGRYMADADFSPMPAGLLDPGYLTDRRRLIDPLKAMTKAKPGTPPKTSRAKPGRDGTIERGGTSHISIVDGEGNAVSMTTTIESGFGSQVMVAGFLLNNELTDFSFRPRDKTGRLIANRVEAGKRPRSSMAPTILFGPDGKLKMVTGSPGGSRIILYVVKSIIAHIDWGLDAYGAAAFANFGSRNGPFEIEPGRLAIRVAPKLRSLGQTIALRAMTSGTHIIIWDGRVLRGGADPRREGRVLGD